MPLANHPKLILENPKYHGNIGMICRLVANFGLDPLVILGEQIPPTEEMAWMATHSKEELEKIIYTTNLDEATASIDILVGTGMIRGGERAKFLSIDELSKAVSGKKFGIIFGREDRGLTKEALSYCDCMLDFQLPGYQKSMNLSHAVSFVLGLLYNFPNKIEINEFQNRETKHFYTYVKKIFSYLGLNSFHNSENLAVRRFKSILNRTSLSPGDIDFFYKIFQSIENLYFYSQKKDKP